MQEDISGMATPLRVILTRLLTRLRRSVHPSLVFLFRTIMRPMSLFSAAKTSIVVSIRSAGSHSPTSPISRFAAIIERFGVAERGPSGSLFTLFSQ